MSNPIQKPPTTKLTRSQLKQLANFTDPGSLLSSLHKHGWTIDDSVRELTAIAKDPDAKHNETMSAIRLLNQMIVDCLERSGLIAIVSRKGFNEEGEEISFTGHMVSDVLQGPTDHTSEEELRNPTMENDNDEETQEQKPEKQGKPQKTSGTGGKTGSRKSGRKSKRDSNQDGDSPSRISEDLHDSRPPELHTEVFKGIAVPSEPDDTGTTGNTSCSLTKLPDYL